MSTKTLPTRLEAATGPDRGLDAEIAVETYGPPIALEHLGGNDYAYRGAKGQWLFFVGQEPTYTASFDAATSLVPEGAWWWVEAQPLASGRYLAGCGDERVSSGATPALALCAASLRAREASNGE